MLIELLAFSDKHPVVGSIFSITAAVFAVVGYLTFSRTVGAILTLLGRRQKKEKGEKTEKKVEAAPERLPSSRKAVWKHERELQGALAGLGYTKAETAPVLASLDLSGPFPDVLRAAIKKLNVRASEVS